METRAQTGASSRTRAHRLSPAHVAIAGSVLAVLMQSVGPVIVRQMHMGGLTVGFNRCWMGAVFTVMLLYAKGGRLSWRVLRHSIAGGIAFGLNIATFFVAVRRTSIANASVIAALQPLVLLLIVNRIFGERPRSGHWIYSIVALSGVFLVVHGSANARTGDRYGDFLAFLAMLLFAAYYVASKKAREHLTTFEYQSGLLIIATLVMAPIALAGGTIVVHRGIDWMWLSLMVLLPGTGHLLINYALAHIPVTIPAVLNLFVPAGSTFAAWLFIGERLVSGQIVGIAIVVGALALMMLSTSRPLKAAGESTSGSTPAPARPR